MGDNKIADHSLLWDLVLAIGVDFVGLEGFLNINCVYIVLVGGGEEEGSFVDDCLLYVVRVLAVHFAHKHQGLAL